MTTATILSWVFAAAPGTSASTEPAPAPIARAEVYHGASTAQIIVVDVTDQIAAEISVGIVDGRVRIEASFPDGIHAMAVVAGDGEIIEMDNDDLEGVAPRLVEIVDVLADTEQDGWGGCALHGTMAVVELAHANPWGIASAVLAACECLPLIVSEFEDMECPL